MNRMRFAWIAAGFLALPGGDAGAQQTMPNMTAIPLGGSTAPVDEATQERRNEVDRNYRAVKGSIPAQEGAFDPWAGMRGDEKPAQKPAPGAKSATAQKKKQIQ